MAQPKDAILNVRMPMVLKQQIASLANAAGVPISEMGRILWERLVWGDPKAATAIAHEVATAKYGPEMADRLARHELRRLQFINNGEATEDEDGNITFKTPEGEPIEEPEATPHREVVRA